MTATRDDFLARCRASHVPEDIALEMWEENAEAEEAVAIYARVMAFADELRRAPGAARKAPDRSPLSRWRA